MRSSSPRHSQAPGLDSESRERSVLTPERRSNAASGTERRERPARLSLPVDLAVRRAASTPAPALPGGGAAASPCAAANAGFSLCLGGGMSLWGAHVEMDGTIDYSEHSKNMEQFINNCLEFKIICIRPRIIYTTRNA